MAYPQFTTVEIHHAGQWHAAGDLRVVDHGLGDFTYRDDYVFGPLQLPVSLKLPVDEVLDAHNTSCDVYADRGYPSAQRSEMLKVLGYREHIQRKAKPGKPLSECQKVRNKRIAKTRARVEHPFAQMRHMGGKPIRSIGQARATVAMTMMAVCYNLKRLAKFVGDGVDAFYKEKCKPSKTEVRLQGAKG